MLDAIRIGPNRALLDTRVYDLGRLNVICGRNNSGKSTFLEAVAAPHRRDAIRFRGKALSSFATAVGPAWSSFHLNQLPTYVQLLEPIFERKPGALWFKDEREEFLALLTTATQTLFRVGEHWNPAWVRSQFDNQFGDLARTVLVPEARHLEVHDVFHPHPEVKPNGKGLVNYLFCSKNLTSIEPARRVYDKIAAAFQELSEGYRLDVVLPADSHPGTQPSVSLVFTRDGSTWIPADSCGYGLRELLVLLYFANHPHFDVVCVEEPEVHMHPDMQRRVARYWRANTSKQFFISTHSNVFLRPGIADRVWTTSLDTYVAINDATSRAVLLAELGYDVTDNLVSDVIVLTEGPTDVPVLEEFFRKRDLLTKYRVRFWPLGGDNMARIDLTPLLEGSRLIALVDNDPGSDSARRTFIATCKRLNIPVTRLQRRAIENYFSLSALREIFGNQIRGDVEALDPDIDVAKQIGLNPKAKNWNVASAMTLQDIEGTDFERFLAEVESLCEAAVSRQEPRGQVR